MILLEKSFSFKKLFSSFRGDVPEDFVVSDPHSFRHGTFYSSSLFFYFTFAFAFIVRPIFHFFKKMYFVRIVYWD